MRNAGVVFVLDEKVALERVVELAREKVRALDSEPRGWRLLVRPFAGSRAVHVALAGPERARPEPADRDEFFEPAIVEEETAKLAPILGRALDAVFVCVESDPDERVEEAVWFDEGEQALAQELPEWRDEDDRPDAGEEPFTLVASAFGLASPDTLRTLAGEPIAIDLAPGEDDVAGARRKLEERRGPVSRPSNPREALAEERGRKVEQAHQEKGRRQTAFALRFNDLRLAGCFGPPLGLVAALLIGGVIGDRAIAPLAVLLVLLSIPAIMAALEWNRRRAPPP